MGKTFRGIDKKFRQKLSDNRKKRQTAHHGVKVDKLVSKDKNEKST